MTMMVLYLRADEQNAFFRLSKTVQDGWNIEEEKGYAFERPEERKMRSLMFHTKAKQCGDALKRGGNLTKDLTAEALFALGTNGLTTLLTELLTTVKTDEDIKGIAELSHIRHALFQSNALHSPSLS